MKKNWQLKDFTYHLPNDLIAHYPADKRTNSRLLCVENSGLRHLQFNQLVDLLNPHDLLVLNNSRVIPARLWGYKPTRGAVEILVERILGTHEALAHVRASRSPRLNAKINLLHEESAEVLGRKEEFFHLKFSSPVINILNQQGDIPLPPYIERRNELLDKDRYQTVYAQAEGSVAAPTAGLHFDKDLLEVIKNKGIDIAFVTLHVGAGTFKPVRVENIIEHHMHSEMIEVTQEVCDKIQQAKSHGGRVIAVGTTSIRCLETSKGKPYLGETNIFIYPGYQFHIVDAAITNFHLSQSSLLMLVCALGGYEKIMHAYQVAIEKKYRFFSYGDAMMVTKAL